MWPICAGFERRPFAEEEHVARLQVVAADALAARHLAGHLRRCPALDHVAEPRRVRHTSRRLKTRQTNPEQSKPMLGLLVLAAPDVRVADQRDRGVGAPPAAAGVSAGQREGGRQAGGRTARPSRRRRRRAASGRVRGCRPATSRPSERIRAAREGGVGARGRLLRLQLEAVVLPPGDRCGGRACARRPRCRSAPAASSPAAACAPASNARAAARSPSASTMRRVEPRDRDRRRRVGRRCGRRLAECREKRTQIAGGERVARPERGRRLGKEACLRRRGDRGRGPGRSGLGPGRRRHEGQREHSDDEGSSHRRTHRHAAAPP